MVHIRTILVCGRIQPYGKRDMNVYKKHSTYLNSSKGEVYIISRCYGLSHCGSTIRIPTHPGSGGVHPHFLTNGDRCDGVCHPLGITEFGAPYS